MQQRSLPNLRVLDKDGNPKGSTINDLGAGPGGKIEKPENYSTSKGRLS